MPSASTTNYRLPTTDYSQHGPPGSAIAGSHLVREYCRHCGLAIRVQRFMVGKHVLCLSCAHDRTPRIAA